jgi:hypothetical protein
MMSKKTGAIGSNPGQEDYQSDWPEMQPASNAVWRLKEGVDETCR